MRAFLVGAVCAVVLSIAMTGCGGGDGSETADTSKPLKGKDVGKTSQLTGTWLAVTEGDFVGFEFMKDGKVLATHAMQAAMMGEGSGMMLTYSVLDGGRLSLTAPDGQTQVFDAVISGDQLELKGQMLFSETDLQRFRRLKAGQTLSEAIEEQQKSEAKAARERYDAVTAYIRQPGLVIVCTTPGSGAPASVAIAPPDADGMQKAWHDDEPPHLDQIWVAVDVHQTGQKSVANVTFGPQLQPPAAQQRSTSPTIPFEITGDPKKPRAIAKVDFGGRAFELELKQDRKLYGEILGRFEAEVARVEALKKPLIAAMKDFAIIEGDSYSEYPGSTKPNTVRIVLVRDEASGNYTGESMLIDGMRGTAAPMPNTTAEVTVIDDKPMLLISCYNRQYQLTPDGEAGKLSGGWFYQGNPSGYVAEVAILEAMDAATRRQKHDAERAVLASLSPSVPLIGLVNHGGTFLPQPGPASLALAVGGDGQVTGTVTFAQVMGVYDVQGRVADTLAGPQLELQFGNVRESGSGHAANLANTLRNQRWAYRVADAGGAGPVKLTDGASVLTQATDGYRAELRNQLADAMAGGLTMVMVNPDYGPSSPQRTFEFVLDPATNSVTGKSTSGSNPFHEQSTVTGELKELAGLPQLVVQIADPPPARAGDFHRTYAAEIVAHPTAEGWYFTAPFWPDTNPTSRGYFDMVEVRE